VIIWLSVFPAHTEGTPYVKGKFRMKLVLSSDYPASPPRGFFLTKIYHPNVASNGDICVNTLKKDWSPETTLKHVLQVIRCLLIVPFPESSLNDEAGKLFMDSYDEFARRARLMTEVHALDETEENGDDSNGEGCGTEEASSEKVSAGAEQVGLRSESSKSENDSMKETTSEKFDDASSVKLSKLAVKDKKKDAKKKSLKRL
jgi:ubiquitin-conjugating enzyme E2 S